MMHFLPDEYPETLCARCETEYAIPPGELCANCRADIDAMDNDPDWAYEHREEAYNWMYPPPDDGDTREMPALFEEADDGN